MPGPGADEEGLKPLSRLVREGGRSPREVAYIDTWYHNANRAAVYAESGACQWDFGSTNLQDSFEAGCFNRLDDPEHATLVEPGGIAIGLRRDLGDGGRHGLVDTGHDGDVERAARDDDGGVGDGRGPG